MKQESSSASNSCCIEKQSWTTENEPTSNKTHIISKMVGLIFECKSEQPQGCVSRRWCLILHSLRYDNSDPLSWCRREVNSSSVWKCTCSPNCGIKSCRNLELTVTSFFFFFPSKGEVGFSKSSFLLQHVAPPPLPPPKKGHFQHSKAQNIWLSVMSHCDGH